MKNLQKGFVALVGMVAALNLVGCGADRSANPTQMLDVPMIAQQNGDWCWLACAQMCMAYGHYGQSYSQEQLLEYGYGLPAGYCSNENPQCNIPGTAQQIQTLLRAVGQSSSMAGPLDPNQVRDELADKHPIVIFLRTSPTIGHFVVVSGIYPGQADGAPTLVLNDPYFGKVQMPYEKLRGLWVQSLVVA